MAGATRLSCFPRPLSLLWFRAGLDDGGTDTFAMTASMLLSRAAWPSCCAMRCSKLSTESSAAVSLVPRVGTPTTVEDVLSDVDLFLEGLQFVLSDCLWEGLSCVGRVPDSGCSAFSIEGNGSFRSGRFSELSCALKSPGLSVTFLRPLVLVEFVTLQLPIALVKRFVCSSLLAGSELGVNPPRDRPGELSEQSICNGVCNPSAKELDSEGSLRTHCSSLLSKPFEGDRWGQDM